MDANCLLKQDPPTSEQESRHQLNTYSENKHSASDRRRFPLKIKTSLNSPHPGPHGTSAGLRPPVNDQDAASSGDDSLLDLYRSDPGSPQVASGMSQSSINMQSNGRKRVASRESSRVRRKGSRGAVPVMDSAPAENVDEESKWIHRDKLAQIESRELAEMGIRMGRPSRAGSRSKSVRTAKSTSDAQEAAPELPDEELPPLTESQRLQPMMDDDLEVHNTQQDTDEFTNHRSQRSEDLTSVARPGTSRIPVPTPSYEEDSPMEARRKRSESFGMLQRRTRSRSDGSQHLLDQSNGVDGQIPPSQASPSKQRSTSKPTPNGNRKASVPRKTSGPVRSRANSNADSPKRPTTSGGSRPPTARPEGEAPWIATMYKPDPRLPPDQQMLPTHAKRMAQMQAEAEAKAVRDNEASEFTLQDSDEQRVNQEPIENDQTREPQANDGDAGNRASLQSKRTSLQQKRSSIQGKRDSGQWPLRAPSRQESEKRASPRPDQGGIEHGGYNLMPLVASNTDQEKRISLQTRTSHRSQNSHVALSEKERQENAALAPVNQPVRLQPTGDEQPPKKKDGCNCCSVM